ncbi:N-acetylglutamate synthase, GNAT family [Lentzea waywayandensis]|uniref:N-acetylglutamate synthase, GNAT family n=1 Tax=Lentzea waywayandensis TaxID=84724 RepID=A0A1I6DYR5_9PSEU|nr:GNAT family N-acetyltransferase [Lentzea waywayandensis]SFR10680.1 N-acetylglutamate synthase, GNAT family [Lentzea waywayandensis]
MGEIEELDFACAPEEDRRGLYEVLATWAVEDSPGKERPPYEACVAMWEFRDDVGFEAAHFAVAREEGKIIGYAEVKVSEAEANAHLANANIVVLPQHRRRGIGTALLRAMPSLLRGRTVIEAWSVFKDSPAEQFAAARGFRVVTTMTRQRLTLTDPPEIGELPAGYELVTWKGAAPEEFVEAYVEALNGIRDAPQGDTTIDLTQNTVESIRREEATAVAVRWVVLLLHEGKAAGVTVVELNSVVPTLAEQLQTVVLPAHRGKGLGRLIKARMLHNLAGVEEIRTRTSSENEHMLRVNHSLGYEDTFIYMAVQAKTADLQP